ncbi:hypothetical protein P175DRAFT_0534681 [Aspergillus ochraceoroseus IBT 24754]|uniref:Uncharacterized protein n=2 Tax=Aspergillus ochraceoroseus TaxID=138278 RepID=A0A2T5LRJ4_9EURO|nr:uncharacterized protein P175DRAFT_0534681 [Aspergillus ochraceoroseus IBT 24754]KKK14068.1 hypothetical protein AOCH_005744 [Aspergillus ochraceoroseus]PTU18902.1 hypothetical protein P175DRAFT_0534681 [Aspergillus ochraceoroseus IBT 24754]
MVVRHVRNVFRTTEQKGPANNGQIKVRFKFEEFNLDVNRISIGSASAGGHLPAVVAHHCRNVNIPLVFTAEMDPLRDEGEVCAEKLKAADGEVEVRK